MIKKLLTFFLLVLFPLFSSEKTVVLNSQNAHFDGKKSTFSGGITVSNELGKLSAKTAIVENKKNKLEFSNATFLDDVVIEMKNGGTLFSDIAVFDDEAKKAVFSSREKDEFVHFTDPAKGVDLTSKQMTIQKLENGELYLLAGDARVNSQDFGDIFCQDMLYIKKNRITGEIENIDCFGKSKITLKKQNCSYKISSQGEIHIDNVQKKITVTSPVNETGDVGIDQQFLIQDQVGKIYSNSAEISYAVSDKNALLKKVHFVGNVRLINRSGPLLQYILSDKADFDQESCQMHFFSTPPNRVLCYDRPNNLEISAPELKVFRDKTTKKDNIKGVGDVRFHLMEQEIEQLKKHIKL